MQKTEKNRTKRARKQQRGNPGRRPATQSMRPSERPRGDEKLRKASKRPAAAPIDENDTERHPPRRTMATSVSPPSTSPPSEAERLVKKIIEHEVQRQETEQEVGSVETHTQVSPPPASAKAEEKPKATSNLNVDTTARDRIAQLPPPERKSNLSIASGAVAVVGIIGAIVLMREERLVANHPPEPPTVAIATHAAATEAPRRGSTVAEYVDQPTQWHMVVEPETQPEQRVPFPAATVDLSPEIPPPTPPATEAQREAQEANPLEEDFTGEALDEALQKIRDGKQPTDEAAARAAMITALMAKGRRFQALNLMSDEAIAFAFQNAK